MSANTLLTERELSDAVRVIEQLKQANRYDLLLDMVGVSTLEQMHIEAARRQLSRLIVTDDYRFLLADYGNVEVKMEPIQKVVYLLFLLHPEGVEFKRLSDYRNELMLIYRTVARHMDVSTIQETIDRLVNPLDNSINEKCSRIKSVFMKLMDEYRANYYIVSGHVRQQMAPQGTWYRRLKTVALPRHLVTLPQTLKIL